MTDHNSKPLPQEGFVKVRQIIAPDGPLPVAYSTWWKGVAAGRFPKPIKIGPNTTAWRVSDIRKLIADLEQADAAA